MFEKTTALAAILVIGGCASAPSQPVVTDYNGVSVRLVQDNWIGEGLRSHVSDAAAAEVCARGGRLTADYASSSMGQGYQIEHFYLCS